MEFHYRNGVGPGANGNGVKGSAEAVNVPCPESVIKGQHRDAYDRDPDSALYHYKTPFTHIRGQAIPDSLLSPLLYHLSIDQIREFHRTGVLVIPGQDVWTADEMKLIGHSVSEVDGWPEAPGKWMKYYEKARDENGNKILCRIENFTQYHAGLDHILNGSKLLSLCDQLFGCESILYKEKINYKLPRGDGFPPHQDVAAGWWIYGSSFHISALVSIDDATSENGCLEVVRGAHNKGIIGQPWKEMDPSFVNDPATHWESLPTKSGDVVFFDSYVPHRSDINRTQKPRRVLYATYGKASEGDYRLQYYADKRLSYPPDIERLQGKDYEYRV